MDRMKHLLSVVAVVVAMFVAAPGHAADPAPKGGCNSINLGGPKVFSKDNMSCKRAKRYARRVYKTDGRFEPRNFSCTSGSNFNDGGSCAHKSKPKYFFWHTAD
jgi:hypothetical protein